MTDDPNAREGPSQEDEEFARQLAAVLRASEEHPSGDFDERVMEAVRAVQALTPVTPLSRWHRQRTLSLPPMAWGALAAGFAIIVSLGTLATANLIHGPSTPAVASARVEHEAPAPAPVAQPTTPASPSKVASAPVTRVRRDTVYMVRFVLADAGAHTVSLVGDFNEWEKRANPLTPDKPGVWSTQVALAPGRHEYAFVVDGKRWVADPSAEHVRDDFDTPSSVVTVGAEGVGGI